MKDKVRVEIFAALDEEGTEVDIIERVAPSAAEVRELVSMLNSNDKAALSAGTGESGGLEIRGGPEKFVVTLEPRALEWFGAERNSGPEIGTERLMIEKIQREYPRRRVLDRGEAMQILQHYVAHQTMHPGFRWIQLTTEDMVASSGGLAEVEFHEPLPATSITPNLKFSLDVFWRIIERAKISGGRDIDDRIDALRGELERLDPADILAFDAHFTSQLDLAYNHDLWGAAYVMQGGCSDDAFSDFRSALISMGRTVFEPALRDPDGLAALPDHEVDNLYAEGFQYVASQVFEETHDARIERHQPHPHDPTGKPWKESETDELQARWPRIFARFWKA